MKCVEMSTGCESDTQFRYFHPDFNGLLYISNMWKNKHIICYNVSFTVGKLAFICYE